MGRMPGPSLVSPRHLSDIITSLEKLEMNNSTETSHLESTRPPPSFSPVKMKTEDQEILFQLGRAGGVTFTGRNLQRSRF